MLEVNDIHVTYGRLRALKGVSLSVRQGEIVCLIGPNGAGKSTTLAAIAGGVVPHRGTMLLDGKPLAAGRPEQIARLGVSLVPEGRHVFGTLTVAENLRVATYMRRDRAAVAADYERVLALFPRLKERIGSPGGRLSGGEQQMLVIARALLTRPRLLLVDEPSLGLAPEDRRSGLRNPAGGPQGRGADPAHQRAELAPHPQACRPGLRDPQRPHTPA